MTGTRGIVTAGHAETAKAAMEILRAGGNAFDAAIAAFWAACVAEPVLTSPGGGGFMLANPASSKARVYDFFVQTPRNKRALEELDFYEIHANFGRVTQAFNIGLGSVAVPGNVRGMFTIHRDLATLPMTELVKPAIELARNGLTLNDFQAYVFEVIHPIYLATASARAIYESALRPNHAKQSGEWFSDPNLADLLEQLAAEGDELFYQGEVATAIGQQSERFGGHINLEDLKHYQVRIRQPLEIELGPFKLTTNPAPASGGTLIAFGLSCALPLMEGLTFGSVDHLTCLAETMAQTGHARLAGHDQPDLARFILDPALLATYRDRVVGRAQAFRGTTHLCVADETGNLASMTTSNGEGCGHLVDGCGFMLNNMLGEEDINPGGFHRWQPNQRMTSMMSPTILASQDFSLVTGSGGSNRIRTAILQVLINRLAFGMDVGAAVRAPRIHFERGKLDLEPGFPPEATRFLTEHYPTHHLWDTANLFFGGAHSLLIDGNGLHGAGDPRRGGVVMSNE